MKTRSRILYAPALPLDSAALAPQFGPASVAGALLADDHKTRIIDLGALDVQAELLSPGLRALFRQYSRPAHPQHRPPASLLAGLLGEYRRRRQEHVSRLLAQQNYDFLLFYANDREEFLEASMLAQALTPSSPTVPFAVFGPYVDKAGPGILGKRSPFACVIIGDAELGVLAWADHIRRPEIWPKLPNLCCCLAGPLSPPTLNCVQSLDELPMPAFDSTAYPAIAAGEKLRLFPLEQSRGGLAGGYGAPAPLLPLQRLRLRSPRRLCEEIHALQAACGAGAFHLFGEATPAGQIERFAYEVLGQGIQMRYSRACAVEAIALGSHCALKASGCTALEHPVYSGSQRLREDYFGQSLGVSQIEIHAKAAAAEGLHLALGFSYPVAWDDYHSYEETLRIIRRCRPHAVYNCPVFPWPGSRWRQQAAEYGFRLRSRRFARWLSDPDASAHALSPVASGAFGLRGWTPGKIMEEQAAFAAELEREGVVLGPRSREGLLADVFDKENKPQWNWITLSTAFQTGSAAQLRSIVRQFNRAVSLPPNTVSFRPFTPVLEAVAN